MNWGDDMKPKFLLHVFLAIVAGIILVTGCGGSTGAGGITPPTSDDKPRGGQVGIYAGGRISTGGAYKFFHNLGNTTESGKRNGGFYKQQ